MSRTVWLCVVLLGLLAAGGALLVAYLRQGPSGPDLAEAARADLERRGYQPVDEELKDYKPVPTQAHPLLGLTAPDFTLTDTAGTARPLADALKAGPVVVVFYYGYHCDHCVSQLFALHKDIDKFQSLGATVLAISADAPELTRARYQQYGAFAFPVLADPGNAVATLYGTYKPGKNPGDQGDLMHGTFVLDGRGHVVWANRGEGPFTDNRTLLTLLQRMRHP